MENILVPTNFSKNCEKAADLALKEWQKFITRKYISFIS